MKGEWAFSVERFRSITDQEMVRILVRLSSYQRNDPRKAAVVYGVMVLCRRNEPVSIIYSSLEYYTHDMLAQNYRGVGF
ncbi:hypothetical protein BaRGS_00023569 [Batillaria attramentaria]|uniref:Uncharacterized protein n=1 Tax=Batillaria attramentaria TaxID=370345 RepID=A0ABD0KDH5_9CAEN